MRDHIAAHSLETVALELGRSFLREQPALKAALLKAEPWLEAELEVLAEEVPLPKTSAPFVAGPFYRWPGSIRSFCYFPSTAVLAFKGFEPCAGDLDVLFRHLRRPCYSPHDIAEHLIFEEQKIPGCLGFLEAVREAESAASIQSAHLSAYGTLARLPLPLFVYRHASVTVERTADILSRNLSAPARRAIEPSLATGLGALVYYYPSPPVRVRDLDFVLQGVKFQPRFLAIKEVCDPEELIARWVRGFVRLLHLRMLPGSLASLRTGVCCDPQNACLDGGFVDLDSVTPIGDLKDDTAVYAGLQISVDSLFRTVRTLVAGGADPSRDESVRNRADLHAIGGFLLEEIRRALNSEARPGLHLDSRIIRYFTPARTLDDLVNRLDSYYAPVHPEFDAMEPNLGLLGRILMKSAGARRG